MRKSYTVAEGLEFNYAADSESQKLINAAGGRTKLSDEDKLRVKYKTVVSGQDCSDMTPNIIELYLERGWIIEHVAEEKTTVKIGKKTVVDEEGAN